MENNKLPQIRVLNYLHISTSNLSKDSNFLLHRFIFKYLFKHYPDNFHFYLTYPAGEEAIMRKFLGKYKHITFVPIKYYSTNAFFRNALDWNSLSNISKDYDMIWNNTPEIAFELLSFSISKGIYCGIMNYAHWYPEIINGPIFANYLSHQPEKYCMEMKYYHNFLLSQDNYMNSMHGKKAIMKGFEKVIGENSEKLKDRLNPLYITVDHEELLELKNEKVEVPDCPVLIFNHRHQVYTGFTEFMQSIKEIIKIRPNLNFKIFISDSGNMDLRDKFQIPEGYILDLENKGFQDYVKILWNLKGIQIGSHTGINQWSMAFMDGMFTNNIPFYRKGIFFDEMFKGMENINPYNFKNEKEFTEKLIFLLENFDEYNKRVGEFYNHFLNNWTWDKLIHPWANALFKVYEQCRTYKNSEKINTIEFETPLKWSKAKEILNISDQRPTNQYRKTLKDKYNLKEDINNSEIILYRENEKIRKTEGFF